MDTNAAGVTRNAETQREFLFCGYCRTTVSALVGDYATFCPQCGYTITQRRGIRAWWARRRRERA